MNHLVLNIFSLLLICVTQNGKCSFFSITLEVFYIFIIEFLFPSVLITQYKSFGMLQRCGQWSRFELYYSISQSNSPVLYRGMHKIIFFVSKVLILNNHKITIFDKQPGDSSNFILNQNGSLTQVKKNRGNIIIGKTSGWIYTIKI